MVASPSRSQTRMEDPVEHQGQLPDASPMIQAGVEPPDPDASLSPDQVSDAPPRATTPAEGERGASGETGETGESSQTGGPGATQDGILEFDVEDGGDAAPNSICGESERPPLVLTGRVPDAIEPSASPGSPGSSAGSAASGRARRGARVLLDPSQALDVPPRPPRPRKGRSLPPRFVALMGGLFGLAAIASVLALVIQLDGPSHTFGPPVASSGAPGPAGGAGPRGGSGKPAGTALAAGARPAAPDSTGKHTGEPAAHAPADPPPAAQPEAPGEPGPWRVAQLAGDEGLRVVTGKLGIKSLTDALEDEHVPRPQVFRILKSFDDAKVFDRPRKSHQFSVAIDRGTKRVKAFEYQASATDVWQAREDAEGHLSGSKLDMKVEQRRVTRAVLVKDDLKAAVVEAGFDDDIVDALDAALGDRISINRLSKGSTLRVVAQEQTVYGRFSRYVTVEAVEYATPKAEKPTRIYHYQAGKNSGFFDERGKAPYQGGWRLPLKLARVTSRFNPKRMHPVLHTLMPHNGTDFGAPSGTPIFAVAHGTVTHVGPHGPSGNLVLLEHGGGIQTGYAHMSRFAQGIKAGDKVETRQLIGYVGTTGRSTGPHLHFSVKKNGVFVDPMTALKMDGERVLPKSEREAFDAFKAEMDKLIDSVPLPERPQPAPGSAAEPDDDDNHDHGEEDDGSGAAAASGATGAAPAPPASPEQQPAPGGEKVPPSPPATPPPTLDDSSVDSAVWKPD
jgi:murein DD-endopeptidase MepM/ murein hydrolase activator NlpD